MNCSSTIRVLLRLSQRRFVYLSSSVRQFRIASNDPNQLSLNDVGALYSVPKNDSGALLFEKILPAYYRRQVKTLEECVWMCRKPFLEVKNCLNAATTSLPSLRVVLWGKYGTGKTMTVCQALHYAYLQEWVVFAVRDDIFKTLIRELLNAAAVIKFAYGKAGIETFECELVWFFEEVQDAEFLVGDWLNHVWHFGLSAPFTASDCVGALLEELKTHSSSGAIHLLVAIDNANSLYGKTVVKRADRTFALARDLTLVHHLRELFQKKWTNGVCLLVADKKELSDSRDSETIPLNTPLELFGEEGFEAIDPFIPVETTIYSKDEISNMYDYYKEKMWITSRNGRSERALKEMMYLSAFNPYDFERLCAFT